MKYDASEKVATRTNLDKMRNSRVGKTVNANEVMIHIRKQRTKWFEHLTRLALIWPQECACNLTSIDDKSKAAKKTWLELTKEMLISLNIP